MQRVMRADEHRITATRVRPGHEAQLIDVCAGGALIETAYRLLPGTSVELQMETGTRHTRIRGQVLRCAVVRVRPSAVVYRGAIQFERHLPWFVDETVVSSPESRPACPTRADATPEVI